MAFLLAFFLLVFHSFVFAQNGPTTWTASPFNAPSFPLAVKNPYVNAWDPQGNGPAAVSTNWARVGSTFFTPMGWYSMITVDGIPYKLMGETTYTGLNIANQVAIIMTPTRTSILFECGTVTVNATYLSPVEPNDIVQQSLPFSYYYLSITSSDKPHEIKVYSDITAEWMAGDNNLQANTSAIDDGSIVYLQTQLTAPSPFQELHDRPMDGIAYYSMLRNNGISWQIADSTAVREAFVNGSSLNNTVDITPHAVQTPFDGLAIVLDLGTIQATSAPVVWAVGVVRDPVIQFTNSDGQIEERRAYYWSKYSSIHDVILGVVNGFGSALANAIALDNQILHDGSQISTNYYDLLALTTRQAMGAIDFTVGQDSSGNLNTSDIKAFMRGAGGIGSGGVNSVDVIYAASPIYLYLNSSILGYLLRPLLEYQESSLYPNAFAAIDIGQNYSMATGNNVRHDEGIEQSGNMLIMTYAHAQRSGDTSLLFQHYNLLRGWADYLVNNSLAPQSQRPSASDFISAVNQTNLALKGIIGIGAMARISSVVGKSDDADRYGDIASSYIQQWRNLAFSTDGSHVVTTYGQDNTYSLLYNLYAHKLLQLDLIPEADFVTQTAFYKSRLVSNQFGLPLNSNDATISRSDWMMFTAAVASDDTLRDELISQLHAYASPNKQNQPFEVVYNPITGDQVTGSSSPAQGAMFALLANNVPVKLNPSGGSTGNGNGSSGLIGNNDHSSHVGAIAGGVVAGVVAIAAIAAGIVLFLRRRRVRRVHNRVSLKNNEIKRVGPTAFSSEVIVEALDPTVLSPFSNTESQATSLSPRPAQNVSSVSLLRNYTSLPSAAASSVGSPPASDASSYYNIPPRDSAISEKQRLAMLAFTDTGDASGSGSGSALHAHAISPLPTLPPSSPATRQRDSVSSPQNDDPDLRTEVQVLRRELERMRQDREAAHEAPPLYDSVLEDGLRR